MTGLDMKIKSIRAILQAIQLTVCLTMLQAKLPQIVYSRILLTPELSDIKSWVDEER